MKELRRLDNMGDIPLSKDTEVTRRFDIGHSHQLDRIPFLALDDSLINNCSDKVCPMRGMLGQGAQLEPSDLDRIARDRLSFLPSPGEDEGAGKTEASQYHQW